MIPVAMAAIGGAVAALAYARRHLARTIEREYAERFPVDADGIADGARGFVLAGTSGCGLLLLHGSGDTPQSLRYLGGRLNASGYTVHAPLLAGHGRTPGAFATATAAAYHASAVEALEQLRQTHARVILIGQSMGGALAATIASETPGLRALVLLAPYLVPPREVRRAVGIAWLWKWPVPYVRGGGDASIHDPVARGESRSYGSFSGGALAALLATADAGRRALATLTLPTLVIHSENDNRIPRASAEEALRSLRAPSEQHWVTGCGHVLTVDYCKDEVANIVLSFLARHAD